MARKRSNAGREPGGKGKSVGLEPLSPETGALKSCENLRAVGYAAVGLANAIKSFRQSHVPQAPANERRHTAMLAFGEITRSADRLEWHIDKGWPHGQVNLPSGAYVAIQVIQQTFRVILKNAGIVKMSLQQFNALRVKPLSYLTSCYPTYAVENQDYLFMWVCKSPARLRNMPAADIDRLEAKALVIQEAVAERTPSTPTDRISTAVAVKDYFVSRHTIARHVADGTLLDYRPPDHGKNAPLQLSRVAVAAKYPRR